MSAFSDCTWLMYPSSTDQSYEFCAVLIWPHLTLSSQRRIAPRVATRPKPSVGGHVVKKLKLAPKKVFWIPLVLTAVHVTTTLVTLAVAVPLPLTTVHDCPVGWVFTSTL